jgi:hypothetical protein
MEGEEEAEWLQSWSLSVETLGRVKLYSCNERICGRTPCTSSTELGPGIEQHNGQGQIN